MNNYISLEEELERQAKHDDDARVFWPRYENVKEFLVKQYYPWIQARCPFFTDHGEQHVASVIKAASELLADYLGPESKGQLKPLELFLILSAIIWHDVGMVVRRSGHAEEIGRITKDIKTLAFGDLTIQRLVVDIVQAHTGKAGLNIPSKDQDWSSTLRNYTVYPRSIAAILRFADEISETRSRISQEIIVDVPVDNRIYWDYASCIVASKADPSRERVVVTFEIQKEDAIKTYSCPPEFSHYASNPENICLIQYIICRLEKMNNERAYCDREFGRYGVKTREIIVRLNLFYAENRVPGYEELEIPLDDWGVSQAGYPQIDIFQGFFDSNPLWHPDNIREVSNNEANQS